MTKSRDVIVIGGAAVGGGVAYHLLADSGFRGRVLVLEPDPSYRRAATALSAGGVRQQFSTPVNILASRYGMAFFRDAPEALETGGEPADICLREGGYLFLATPSGKEALRENWRTQTAQGAKVEWLSPDNLRARFPWLKTEDLAAGSLGRRDEGWLDGYALARALRRKTAAMGAEWKTARATGFRTEKSRVVAVLTEAGEALPCGAAAVCAGLGGPPLLERLGVNLPVRPRKRIVFSIQCRDPRPDNFPMLVDASGAYVRPEGDGFICGRSPGPQNDPEPDADDFTPSPGFFEREVWPALAARAKMFEALRPGPAWAGHYDMNLFDGNAFAGRAPDWDNVYLACGFSGHGLQHSPAMGRGLAELIARGEYSALDLSPLDCARLKNNAPLMEREII